MRRHLTATVLRTTHGDQWRHLQAMTAGQWLPASEIQERHDRFLAATLRHAVEQVPRYRDLAATAGLSASRVSAADLGLFPLVDKTVMTAEQESFLAADASAGDRISESTGGSSGVWFGFYYDRRFKEVRRAGDLYSRVLAGWRPGDPMAVVWGHRGDVAATAGLKNRVANALLHRRVTLNAYDMDDAAIESYVRRLERHKPRIILGYASSLAFLAEYLGRRGRHSIAPVGIISSAETLDDERRAVISAEFRCPVLNRYGSREFANIAQQCDRMAGLHIFADRIHVEVLRPDGSTCEPGERGEIVVTDLINNVMPFIRYRTGDLGVLSAEPCSCGRGLPVLSSVEGRVSELIVGPNGKYYSCQSPRLFGADIPGIAQMQVIQSELTSLEVKIVPDGNWTDDSRRQLVDRMQGLLGEVEVLVTLTNEIPPAPSGKYRFTISKVSPFDRSRPVA